MKKLSRHAFMEWLKSFSAKKVVGTSCKIVQCPIARFLGEGMAVNPEVYGPAGKYSEPDPETEHPTPGWARKFIDLIDSTFRNPRYGYRVPGDITAARALEVLRKAR